MVTAHASARPVHWGGAFNHSVRTPVFEMGRVDGRAGDAMQPMPPPPPRAPGGLLSRATVTDCSSSGAAAAPSPTPLAPAGGSLLSRATVTQHAAPPTASSQPAPGACAVLCRTPRRRVRNPKPGLRWEADAPSCTPTLHSSRQSLSLHRTPLSQQPTAASAPSSSTRR
jgi:hypothetical protein